MQDQRNLLLAIVLSVAILFGFQMLFVPPPPEAPTSTEPVAGAEESPLLPGAPTPSRPGLEVTDGDATPVDEAIIVPRVPIETGEVGKLTGSIAVTGARIDDLVLTEYREGVPQDSPQITLLSRQGSPHPYFVEFGWIASDRDLAGPMPGPKTPWQTAGTVLAPDRPLVLTWDNGAGLTFERTISLDQDYMFTISQSVRNTGTQPIELSPYGLISRTDEPDTLGFYILHEGPIGAFNGELKEFDYDEVREDGTITETSTGGWIGITDKYWLAALIPDQASVTESRFVHSKPNGRDKFQVDYLASGLTVPAGGQVEVTNRLFAGAKEVPLIDGYQEQFDIAVFDRAIDFGYFYFLTKPLFYVLHEFNGWFGNFGLAILGLTVIIKLIFFPLANKSYVAMSKLKKLQPEMMKLREAYGDDKQKMNQEVMALYKREKANPLAGCLPILIQIPVFFALYKVLFVSIEMRHAPFYGWVTDLSARDPTSLFNLFGLIPFTPPEFLMIGVWPLLMGFTMFLQQKLNPAPPDPIQARVMMMLPVIFIFLFATFPAGLVIYWTWNNVLSIAQQWVIMRRMGVRA